jgi:tripeptidyl-peptidase-1
MLYTKSKSYTYNLQQYVVGDKFKSPDWVREYYQVPPKLYATQPTNYQAIAALDINSKEDDQDGRGFYSPNDLGIFYEKSALEKGNVDKVSMANVVNNPKQADVETQLDIQWITAMGFGARTSVWHSASNIGTDTEDPIDSIIQTMQDAPDGDRPWVLSFSYGGPERGFPDDVLAQLELGFASLGVLGVTVLVSSGDSGAFSDAGDCTHFEPMYPASSAYVTSVGATQLIGSISEAGKCRVAESVCSYQTGAAITSGGGFSKNIRAIPRPAWQKDAVHTYIAGGHGKTVGGGRGYPDISFFGHVFSIIHNGGAQVVDGTSASAPALGGLITLINDVLVGANKTRLGPLNPLLYKLHAESPEVFNDVVNGDNKCHREGCCEDGYPAAVGWDPVTGVGTPNFEAFARAAGATIEGNIARMTFESTDCFAPDITENASGALAMWVILVTAITIALVGVGFAVLGWKYWSRRHQSNQLQQPFVRFDGAPQH